jgi:hypothetical protein
VGKEGESEIKGDDSGSKLSIVDDETLARLQGDMETVGEGKNTGTETGIRLKCMTSQMRITRQMWSITRC